MLTTLRNSAQSWFIKALLGVIVITFVISFGVGTFTNPKEVLVEVGSEEIMVSDFLRQYQEELDRLRQRFPENADVLANQLNLRQQVFDRMVNRRLLLRAAEAQGLRVTPQEVRDAVTREPAFRVEERFDFETYRQILRQNNLTPGEYEARMRDDLLMRKHQRGLLAGVVVSEEEVERRYRIENERVEVDYVHVAPARFELPQPPGGEALQAYYEAHPDRFTQPAQFKLRYVVLSLEGLEADAEVHPRAVERYYERNRDSEFSTPKRVRASHILKRLPQEEADEAAVAAAREALQQVLARARSGEDFAALAREHSEDFSAENGGDLGYFTRDEMVSAFADTAFALPEGAISDIVRSPFGLHIIKVTDVEPGSQQSLEEVRGEILAKLRTRRAERTLELELERLPARIAEEGLAAVAAELGVEVASTDYFDGNDTLEKLGSASPLYAQLKQRRKGHTGVWQRNPVLGHVFYEVADRRDAYVKPFEQVADEVARLTAAQQRRELALEEAKAVFEKLERPRDFTAYARRRGLDVRTVSFTVVERTVEGVGANNEFQRSAFGLSGDDPFALNIKDGKAYIMRFQRRFYAEPGRKDEIMAEIREQMEQQLRQYVFANEIDRLRAGVEIEVVTPEYLMAGPNGPVRTASQY